jgi:hypothetical protein
MHKTELSKFKFDANTSERVGETKTLLRLQQSLEIDLAEEIKRGQQFIARQIASRLIGKMPPVPSNLVDYLERNLPMWVESSTCWTTDKVTFESTPVEILKGNLGKFQNLDESPMSKKDLVNFLNHAWMRFAKISSTDDTDNHIKLTFCLENEC